MQMSSWDTTLLGVGADFYCKTNGKSIPISKARAADQWYTVTMLHCPPDKKKYGLI